MASSSGCPSSENRFHLQEIKREIDRVWPVYDRPVSQEAPLRQNISFYGQTRTHIASSSRETLGSNLHVPISYATQNHNEIIMKEDTSWLTQYSKRLFAQRAASQEGSKYFQKKIKEDPKLVTNIIYEAVLEYMFDIMIGEFGNYVFARVIENCDEPRLVGLVEKLTSDDRLFVVVVCNKYGVESVKRLIKVLEKSPLVCRITSIIGQTFKRLMTNQIAPYVVFKCFNVLTVEQNKELYELLVHNCIELATDERGCIALNESIDYLKQPYRGELFHRIADEARFLSQDPSGNYVVQKVMAVNNAAINRRIYSTLKGYFVDFCTYKASSHVVEKCLNCDTGKNYVLQDFLEYSKLWQIARNQYGNYVIQRALKITKCTNSPFYAELLGKLSKDKEKFRTGYGKNVYALVVEGV